MNVVVHAACSRCTQRANMHGGLKSSAAAAVVTQQCCMQTLPHQHTLSCGDWCHNCFTGRLGYAPGCSALHKFHGLAT